MTAMTGRTCQFCKKHDAIDNLVKYGVRHYAHAVCGYRARGEAWIAGLHRWQREQLPALALVKAGLPLGRLEALDAGARPGGDETMVSHRYKVGDMVEAHPGPHGGPWIKAIIRRHEPYRGRPGYYVDYPGAANEWECRSGWQPENCLREAST